MTKIINKKLLILICAIALVFLGMGIRASADALPPKQTSVELKVTNNGTPVIHTSYSAMNIDRAYQEIKNGEISLKARNSSAWISATQNTNSESDTGVITLSNGKQIGQGITHTDEEMGSLISGLINVDNLSLLSEINQSDTTVPFLNPDHLVYKFTNKNGEAKADIEQGYTLIFDNNNNFINLSKLENASEKVVIDLADIDNKMKFTADSDLKPLATNFGRYIVNPNEKISFTLSISRDMWQRAEFVNLHLPSKSNLSLDSIELLEGNDAVEIITNSSLDDAKAYSSVVPTTAATLVLHENENENDILLRVTVHVNLEGHAIGSNKLVNTSLCAISLNRDGSSNTTATPNFKIAGINFAMTNKNGTEFAQGGKFVLAKSKGGTYEVYGKDNNWYQLDDLNNVQALDALVLEGGQRYILGSEQAEKIPLNVLRFNFNEKRSKKINESLIQVLGIAQGDNYFLYRIDTADNLSSANRIYKFSIFNRSYFSPNNTLKDNNSFNNPTNPLIGLSGQIPDYAVGNKAYSNLSLDGSGKERKGAQIYIVLAISMVVIVILAVTSFIVKNRGW